MTNATYNRKVAKRDTLLGFKPKTMFVALPHSENEVVIVRQITAGERATLVKSLDRSTAGALEMMAALVLMATVNEDGSQLFSSRAEVDGLPADIVQAIADAAMNVNGMAQSANETTKN